jgi:hypothetical protein
MNGEQVAIAARSLIKVVGLEMDAYRWAEFVSDDLCDALGYISPADLDFILERMASAGLIVHLPPNALGTRRIKLSAKAHDMRPSKLTPELLGLSRDSDAERSSAVLSEKTISAMLARFADHNIELPRK